MNIARWGLKVKVNYRVGKFNKDANSVSHIRLISCESDLAPQFKTRLFSSEDMQ